MNTQSVRDLYDKFQKMFDKVSQTGSDHFSIMAQANNLISRNSIVSDIFLDEFKYEIETYLDQKPFESVQHIGSDLNRLINAINKEYHFN
ncbi:hypothetical protein [Dyadobacter psychrotolerans]|uniref:Uncharacterized protein n=1 Tax=Dyadobacter psychrotolerans TaxID=2541721 RepID=A0A4R5DH39_9BACT|nr:hypothetical protein [Dyadobacter psychrotolerans]TDE09783.1 hypothetical protein E0F88_29780 [Dyadobacter psychrotolerans]